MSHGASSPPDAPPTVPEPPPGAAPPPIPAPGPPSPSSAPPKPTLTQGPAPGPKWIVDPKDPRDWWNTRDRRLRGATIGLGAVTGAAFLASGGFLVALYLADGRSVEAGAGARATAGIGFLALPALIGVGAAWGVYRRRGWEAPPAVLVWPRIDPRLDPAWVKRDRRLRGATIGVGAFAGAWLLSIPLTLGIYAAGDGPSDCSQPDSCNAPISGEMVVFILVLAESAMFGASLLALAGVGGAWGAHRRPLRRWNMSLAPGGLQIRF